MDPFFLEYSAMSIMFLYGFVNFCVLSVCFSEKKVKETQ
jgi:hypothetical protein